MGGSCGNTENMTINEHEAKTNSNNANQSQNKKTPGKKNEVNKKTANNKENEKFKDMEEYGMSLIYQRHRYLLRGKCQEDEGLQMHTPLRRTSEFSKRILGYILWLNQHQKKITAGFGKHLGPAVKPMEKQLTNYF